MYTRQEGDYDCEKGMEWREIKGELGVVWEGGENGKSISRMTSHFLLWIGEWAVGFASEIEDTERTVGLRKSREGGGHQYCIG